VPSDRGEQVIERFLARPHERDPTQPGGNGKDEHDRLKPEQSHNHDGEHRTPSQDRDLAHDDELTAPLGGFGQ